MCTGLTLEQFGTHAKELEPTIMRSQGMWNYCGHDGILLAPNRNGCTSVAGTTTSTVK